MKYALKYQSTAFTQNDHCMGIKVKFIDTILGSYILGRMAHNLDLDEFRSILEL